MLVRGMRARRIRREGGRIDQRVRIAVQGFVAHPSDERFGDARSSVRGSDSNFDAYGYAGGVKL